MGSYRLISFDNNLHNLLCAYIIIRFGDSNNIFVVEYKKKKTNNLFISIDGFFFFAY